MGSTIPNLEHRVAQLEKEMAVMQNEHEHIDDAINTLGDRITGMNDKKLAPMQKQLTDIHEALHGSRGFMAGVFLTVSMIWAVFATFGIVIWNWLRASN